MRYLSFTLTLIFSLFITTSVHATTYPLTAVQNGNVITVTMSGVTDTISDFNLFDGSTPVPAPEAVNTGGMIKKAVNGSVLWEIKGAGFKNDYTYYLNAKKISPGIVLTYESVTDINPFKTGTGGTNAFYTWPTVSGATGQKATIQGKIDLSKYPNVSNLKIDLKLSLTPGFSNALTYTPHTTNGGTVSGVGSDGSYYWNLGTQTPSLSPSTTYYIQQNIYEGTNTTPIATKADKFDSSKGYLPEGSAAAQNDFASRSYRLLAPFPGLAVLMDPDLCDQQKAEGKLPEGAICDINGLINFAFKLLIGLTALVLVFRLMYEGYQYMVTDVPFLKASAKGGFMTALMGLLLALSAYLILNTINPKLVSNSINLASVDVGVEEFTISGALSSSFTATPVKVKFSTEAYPAAKNASEKTGVNVSFILAEFQQETGNGANVGKCRWTDAGVMKQADKVPFQTITSELGRDPNNTVVSCASGGGWGGAIGLMQFRPATWLENRLEAKNYLGHMPDPWKTSDALMVAAVYLKKLGGVNDIRNAACKYYSGSVCTPGRQPPNEFYGNEIMQKKAGFDLEIQKKKASGEIQ